MRLKRLRQLRLEKGLTQTALAKLLGISKSAISRYENGLRMPSEETLIDISRYFKVSVDYLLGISPVRNTIRATFTDEELATAEAVFVALINMIQK